MSFGIGPVMKLIEKTKLARLLLHKLAAILISLNGKIPDKVDFCAIELNEIPFGAGEFGTRHNKALITSQPAVVCERATEISARSIKQDNSRPERATLQGLLQQTHARSVLDAASWVISF